MGSAIYAHTTIVSSSYRAPHGLCSYNMASTKGRRKHSRHNTDPKTDNNPATRHESHPRMLQNHTHSGNGDGDRPTTTMDPASNQSPPINHAHAVTLPETSHPRMDNTRIANKNRSYTTSIKLRKHTTEISIYIRKKRDNKTIN